MSGPWDRGTDGPTGRVDGTDDRAIVGHVADDTFIHDR